MSYHAAKAKKVLITHKYFKKIVPRTFLVILTAQLLACGGSDDSKQSQNTTTNPPADTPSAVINTQTSVKVGTTIIVDASQSSVDDSLTLRSFNWTLTPPANSQVASPTVNKIKPSFTPDLPGQYIIALVVSDGQQSSDQATVIIQADELSTNSIPNAVIDTFTNNSNALIDTLNSNTQLGTLMIYSGIRSSDPDAADIDLNYQWSLMTPAGSTTTLDSPTNANGSFTPDVVGSYTLSLVVSDGSGAASQQVNKVIVVSDQDSIVADFTINNGTGNRVNLDGEQSVVPNNFSFSWSSVFSPSDNAPMFFGDNTLTPYSEVQATGDHLIKLSILDAQNNVVVSRQKHVLITDIGNNPDDPNGVAGVKLLNPGEPVKFTRGCGGGGDITIDATADLNIAFENDLTSDSNGGNSSVNCRVRYALVLPDSLQLVDSVVTISGTRNGSSLTASLSQSRAGTISPETFVQLTDGGATFTVSDRLEPEDNSTQCGGVVGLKSSIRLSALDGTITVPAGNQPPRLTVKNTFKSCN